ncbi:MAG: hypothetical protein PWP23_3082 [Candidatus Sumerlaeota bacterium]|nr:hypothetical protein [Candidatus Sumerlaeota bacterium]
MFKRLLSGRKETPAPIPPVSAPATTASAAAGEAAMPPGALIDCAGIDWNPDEQLAFVRDVLPEHAASGAQAWKHAGGASASADLLDAAVLHAMVTRHEPTRIMQVGCGATTHVIRAALAAKNLPGELIAIDPSPSTDISEVVDAPLLCPVQEIPRSDFEMLRDGEMLILDLTHIIVPGGEVLYLYQHILPHLNPNVIVGVRGTSLPNDYSEEQRRAGWTEQALLQLYLTGNSGAAVLFAGGWIARHHAEETASLADGAASTWLWFRTK